MKINEFIIKNNIIGISIGTFIATAIMQWSNTIRDAYIEPLFTENFKLSENMGSALSATIELVFFTMIIIAMFMYIIIPALEISLEEDVTKSDTDLEWKNKILKKVEDISDDTKKLVNNN